jgi:hypothetical protein
MKEIQKKAGDVEPRNKVKKLDDVLIISKPCRW